MLSVSDSDQPILAAEPIHPSGSVHDFLLTGVERMRVAGDFHLNQRILLAVSPLDRILGGQRGAGQEGKIGGDVLKHHLAVLGMNAFFHDGGNLANAVGQSAVRLAPGRTTPSGGRFKPHNILILVIAAQGCVYLST